MNMRTIASFVFFIAYVFTMSSTLKAQVIEPVKPANGIWSLQQCIDYGVEKNIAVMQNQLLIQSSENTLYQSKFGRWIPTANASASVGSNFGRSIDPSSNQFIQQTIYSSNLGLNLNLTIFNGLQQVNTIKRNEVNVDVNKLNVQQTEYNTALNVALAYLQILQNKELLETARKQVEVSKTQLDRTQKQYDAGAVAITSVVNLQAQVENDDVAVVNAENQVILAKLSLMQQMNLPADDVFDIEKVQIADFEPKAYPENPSQIFSVAESSQPNIQSADLSIRLNELNVEIARGLRYPTLSATGTVSTIYSSASRKFATTSSLQNVSIGTVDGTGQNVSTLAPVTSRTEENYPFYNQYDDNLSQTLGLRLTIPIFNGFQNRTSIRNNMISVENAKLGALNTRIQLRQTIEQAYANVKAAEKTYKARTEQVRALQLAYETTERSFNAGATNSVDFSIAKINLDRAKSDLIRAKYDYLFRTKVLDFYQNKPLTF